jgi:prephenate dehydrogenase
LTVASKQKIGKLVIIGVGLIGGSFALALKKARVVKHVVGIGRTRRNLKVALDRGIVDEIGRDVRIAVRDADLVFLGTPVGQMAAVMSAIAPVLPAHAIITDGGSTKQDVIGHAQEHLGPHYARFVPSHPIAGTEHSGAGAAFADLYRDRRVILTPRRETSAAAVRAVRAAWMHCGARVMRLDAREHDEILAAVSHLPHVVAFALVNALARRPNGGRLLSFSGGGLRDTVRIAGSSPEMWRDICLANRVALLAAIDGYANELASARAAIERGDGEALADMFAHARSARQRWLLPKR